MSPQAKCSRCKKTVEFHDEELEEGAGPVLCMDCRLDDAELDFVWSIATGEREPPPGSRSVLDKFDR